MRVGIVPFLCTDRQGFRGVTKTLAMMMTVLAARNCIRSVEAFGIQPRVLFPRNLCALREQESRDRQITVDESNEVPLYRAEGLFAVYKPLDWTSQDVVSYVRGMLEREARNRGAQPMKVGSRRNKSRTIKVGHGGTLDPLATGVLVIGVGKGTKELQSYLEGPKRYVAGGELGFETTTLDMEGNVTKRMPYDHVTEDDMINAIPQFCGKIQQLPPIFSAIKKNGKKLYKEARAGKTEEDVEIEPREVEILSITTQTMALPKFEIDVECGGGTYIRSLIRDIGRAVGSAATTTKLERTRQGQFTVEDTLSKEDWSADTIYAAIEACNRRRSNEQNLRQ